MRKIKKERALTSLFYIFSINHNNSSLKFFLSNFCACSLINLQSKVIVSNSSIALFNDSTV
ncbi:MAG: hypothetical protein Q8S84_04905 [bacterium]|nr:hypothetical protein [bacterium]MDP3380836.1 hypothetical protein [bacterium]